MPRQLIVVKAARDEESRVWFVESSDLPGLNAEADSLDDLIEKLPAAILDLLEEGGMNDDEGDGGGGEREVPIKLIAHASTRLRVRAPA
jgi:predicted RNase H-like HicB family nuclease